MSNARAVTVVWATATNKIENDANAPKIATLTVVAADPPFA